MYTASLVIFSIQKIADKYNLKIIYDSAHAFGVKQDNKTINFKLWRFINLEFSWH